MTLILTIEIHVLQKRAYLTYSAIKVVYTAFTAMLRDLLGLHRKCIFRDILRSLFNMSYNNVVFIDCVILSIAINVHVVEHACTLYL